MAIRISRTMGVSLGALAFAGLPLRCVVAEQAAATTTTAPVEAEQVIVIQHATAADIIKLMHWDDKAQIPDGVQSVKADVSQNTLKVVANADGLATVKELVKDIDVPVRQIQIDVHAFMASQKDIDSCGIHFATPVAPGQTMAEAVQAASRHEQVMTASGKSIADMLKVITAKGKAIAAPRVTTSNNVNANIKTFNAGGLAGLPGIEGLAIGVTPRANSDNTVTLPVKVELDPVIVGVPKDPTPPKIVEELQTVRDGETFVMVNVAQSGTGNDARQLVVFFTPHLLPLQ